MANPSTRANGFLVTETEWNELVNDLITLTGGGFVVVLDGGGAVLSTDLDIDVGPRPYAGTVASVAMKADQVTTTDTVALDIWRHLTMSDTPVSSDSIVASAPPTILAGNLYAVDATLTGWNKTVTAGDWWRVRVTACASVTRCTLGVRITKTF